MFSPTWRYDGRMLFFALLTAFLLEQFVPLVEDNVFHKWARRWALYARSKVFVMKTWHVWLWWSVAVVVPTLLSALLYQFLSAIWWPLAWLWLVSVLYLTMGFRQFSHYFSRIRDALQAGREDEALAALAQWRQVDGAEAQRSDWVARVLSLALLAAQRHVLGVWLAFVVLGVFGLGPAGAVLYRLSEYVARLWRVQLPSTAGDIDEQATDAAASADTAQDADNHVFNDDEQEPATLRALVALQAWHYVDWLPVRVSALGFAAAGHFEGVVAAWRDASDSAQLSNDSLLLAAGAGALNVTLQEESTPSANDEPGDDDLVVMSAALLDEHAAQVHAQASVVAPVGAAGEQIADPGLSSESKPEPESDNLASAPKPRHVAALASLVWRVVVLAMGVLAGLTLVSWLN
ncbi:MAG: adenosylcobinamide-phosphate synthase [Burkholderiaceae bacterium]